MQFYVFPPKPSGIHKTALRVQTPCTVETHGTNITCTGSNLNTGTVYLFLLAGGGWSIATHTLLLASAETSSSSHHSGAPSTYSPWAYTGREGATESHYHHTTHRGPTAVYLSRALDMYKLSLKLLYVPLRH